MRRFRWKSWDNFLIFVKMCGLFKKARLCKIIRSAKKHILSLYVIYKTKKRFRFCYKSEASFCVVAKLIEEPDDHIVEKCVFRIKKIWVLINYNTVNFIIKLYGKMLLISILFIKFYKNFVRNICTGAAFPAIVPIHGDGTVLSV